MRSIALILFALCAAPAALRAQREAPDADEYAVWSAVLDSAAQWASVVRVVDSAFVLEVAIGQRNDLMMADGMAYRGFDSAAIADFVERNARGVRLERRFSTRREIGLVRPDLRSEVPLSLNGTHLVYLSRPGFNAGRTRAVVSIAVYCGVWCGQGSFYELQRDPGGVWRVMRRYGSWVT